MGQPYRIRLHEIKDEVLAFTKQYGWQRAMDKYELRDPIAFWGWLKLVTGNPDYGAHPEVGFGSAPNLDTGIVEKFAHYVVKTQALLSAKDDRIAYLESICKTYEKRNYDLALPVLRMLEVEA